MALWADTWNIKCQQGSLGRPGSSNDSRVSRWIWGSSLTLQLPRDTWAVIPAEVESPLVPTWLFTYAPPHTCHRDSPQAEVYAVIPLIHSIWWHHVTALLYGSKLQWNCAQHLPLIKYNQAVCDTAKRGLTSTVAKVFYNAWGGDEVTYGKNLLVWLHYSILFYLKIV